MSPERILLGTSGWSYKEWVEAFYKTENTSKLAHYSSVFNTVEIDSTFYAYPSEKTIWGWTNRTPRDFVFTAKIPKIITHDKLLNLELGVEEDVYRFLHLVTPMNEVGKLGCLLIQLPPKLEFDLTRLQSFLNILPKAFRYAVEFRNLSWMRDDTFALLKRQRVAYTIVDEPLLPPDTRTTTDFAYFRWHGKGTRPWFNYRYGKEELKSWLPKLKETTSRVKVSYGFFNNHFHGYAVENCLQILEMLQALTPKQTAAKRRIETFRDRAKSTDTGKLDDFIEKRDTI